VVRYSSRVVSSEAVYSCEAGYKLMFGDQVQTCLRDRNWSGVAPFCIRKGPKMVEENANKMVDLKSAYVMYVCMYVKTDCEDIL